jgi:hypothetical protein
MNLRLIKLLLVLPIIASLFAFSFNGKGANEIDGLSFSKDVENSVIKVVKETNKNTWNAKIIKSDKPEYAKKYCLEIVFTILKKIPTLLLLHRHQ